jgi:hypothetical protein
MVAFPRLAFMLFLSHYVAQMPSFCSSCFAERASAHDITRTRAMNAAGVSCKKVKRRIILMDKYAGGRVRRYAIHSVL